MKTKLILFLVILLVGCAPAKKIVKTNVTQKLQTNTEVTKVSDEKTNLTTSVNSEKKSTESVKSTASVDENETEETTIHTIVYDPKLYTDSTPNRPLKVSETLQTTVKGKGKKAVESTETLYSAKEVTNLFATYLKSYDLKIDSLSKVNALLKSEVSTKTEQASNWWKWFLAGICICVLFQLAWKFTPAGKLTFIWQKFISKFVTSNNK